MQVLTLPLPRWCFAISPAAVLTVLLFLFMVHLVHQQTFELDAEERPLVKAEFFKYKPIETRPEIEAPKKQELEPPPELPKTEPQVLDPSINTTIPAAPIVTPGFGPTIGFSSMPIPQYQAVARYPNSAIRRGLEGYVDVIFDVSAAGITENIRVISAVPEGIFDKAAVNAVKRWRYQPSAVNGDYQAYKGLRQRIRFQMEKPRA